MFREISFQERNYQLDIEITNLNGNVRIILAKIYSL